MQLTLMLNIGLICTTFYLVLASPKCLVLQPVEKKVVRGVRTFVLDPSLDFVQVELDVDSLDTWMACEVVCIPPSIAKVELGGVRHPTTHGCFLKQAPGIVPLLISEFAAQRAFHNLNTQQMQWFAKLLKLKPKDKIVGETAWARFLMNHFLTWNSEQIDFCIREWRGSKTKQVVEVCVFVFKW